MTKTQRKTLEELSFKLCKNKNMYRQIEKHGLTYNEPGTNNKAKLTLSYEGIKNYLEQSIEIRQKFIQGVKENATEGN